MSDKYKIENKNINRKIAEIRWKKSLELKISKNKKN
jgi:hypothetical protein